MTLAKLNEALHRSGVRDTLHKGKGYFYFTGPDADHWKQQGVYVNRLTQLTEQGWLLAYQELRAAS